MQGTRALFTGAFALVASLMVRAPGAAHAEEKTCRSAIGARTLDNVRVPDGATCTLEGTRVEGTIKVESDATLKATNVRVIGNVQGEDARKVAVVGSRIGGSYQVVQSGKARIVDTRVKGDILVDENDRPNTIVGNRVIQDV